MSHCGESNALGCTIARTSWYTKSLIAKLLREEESGITYEQWLVLNVIVANPALSQTQIAELSQKDKTNITRLIDVLEKGGFIERRKDDYDRRMYRIYATQAGLNKLKEVEPLLERAEAIITNSLTKEEKEAFIEALNAVCARIEKQL